ncbi:hypothetical protein, partial [Vibrio owensii]|uniref:hypothetical protein n=1 Tax=Vibrio owensii TaxID=696485 RepID=UPI0005B37184
QRIPNPRVGSSNLSTPAIFKALVERLEPFSYLYLKTKATDPLILKTARVGIWGASSVEPLDRQVYPCHILNSDYASRQQCWGFFVSAAFSNFSLREGI